MEGPGIAPDLMALATPVDDLYLLPGNPRHGDVDRIAASYRVYGQMKPIVAQPDGMIIAGNHQWMAARQLGWTHIAVVRSNYSDNEARGFALADNHIGHDLGSIDEDLLADMLSYVADDPILLEATGYSAEDISRLVGELEPSERAKTTFGVVIEVDTAEQQSQLLAEMGGRSLRCRAL